ERGLVSYYHQRSRQYFTAEDPIRVSQLIEERAGALERARQSYDRLLPNLRAQYERAGGKPTASFYEGDRGVHDILDDLIATVRMRRPREYVAYSSASIRPHLYRAYPGFSTKRIASRIHVRVVSFGPGGRLVGLDERRWLPKRVPAPTYTLIYADRVAHISVDERGMCRGTVVTDAAIAQSQRLLFDMLWTTLPSRGH
ncbi:MAG: hypothetical protein HY341_02830, partial [Candidatus Kerfeldbacteria bacterium]|nr:hypothetical protein [Candidatus Kerfeldbacteria bacterium]